MIHRKRFAYSTLVPTSSEPEWKLSPADNAEGATMPFGREPTLSIVDADPPTNATAGRPWVMRSRFTLTSADQKGFFYVDRSLTSALRGGDAIHIAQTERGSLGLSVLRNGSLIAAVGAITAIPLGHAVRARVAPDLWETATALADGPYGIPWDPREEYRHQWPIEFQIGDTTALFFLTNENIQGIQIFMKHAFLRAGVATGDQDECVALSRVGRCSDVGATASAFLLAADGLQTE